MKGVLMLVVGLMLAFSAGAQEYVSRRPAEADRLFSSLAVEAKVKEMASLLTNPKLFSIFAF